MEVARRICDNTFQLGFIRGVGFTHCLYYGGPCLVAMIWNVDTHKDWSSKYKFIHDLLN